MPPDDSGASFLALHKELSIRYPASERSYDSGVRLIEQGYPIDHVYLLNSGIAKLSFVDQFGQEFILGLRSKGCIIGGEAAILDAPSLLTATMLTGCSVRQVPAAEFRNSLKTSAAFSSHLIRAIARESIDKTCAAMEATSGNTRRRLIRLLRQLEGRGGSIAHDPLPRTGTLLKKHEIAKLLGITPEHLSRLLRVLHREGLLHRDRRRVMLVEPANATLTAKHW